jgi:hypothetical protein
MPTCRALASLVVALTLVPAPALAETLTNAGAGVSLDVPAGWTKKSTREYPLVLLDPRDTPASNGIGITFSVAPVGSVTPADVAERQFRDDTGKIAVTDHQDVVVNGMKGSVIAGNGRMRGNKFHWMVMILHTPNAAHDLTIIALGPEPTLAARKAEVKSLLDSIRPSEKDGAQTAAPTEPSCAPPCSPPGAGP